MQQFSQEIYSFNEFTLDLVRGCLVGGNRQEIKLRPKSFATLRYLVQNNGRLVSKDELIDAVWPDTAVTDNSLVQCLKEVREALGDKSQQYIKTVPRRGYIFTNVNRTQAPGSVQYIENDEGIRAVYVLAPSTSLRPRKIAILPFKSLSGDENDKYLGLGIADTLITRLGTAGQIVVRPTSSIQKYASTDQDSITAGREQQVDAVLEGSIQKSGDKVRVTVRLLSVADGSTLWAYKSDENFGDLFTIEDSVSEKLASTLAFKLTGEQRQRLAKRYTDNTEAYQLYAKGVFLRSQMNQEALQKSVECFKRAVELDPNYALAYAGQASSISPLVYLGLMPFHDAESLNRSLINKALDLDNSLPEAHAAFAEFKLFMEWDWDGAEREFKRALELNPNDSLTLLLYPDLLLIKGRTEEALAMSKVGFDLDPLSARTGKALAHTYYFAGKYDEALEQSKKTLELFPNYHFIFLGPIYEQKCMHDQSIAGYLESEERWGLSPTAVATLRQAYATSGWAGYWRKRLELAEEEAKERPVGPVSLAQLYARVGDKDKAFEWLQRAYDLHDMSLTLIKVDPVWQNIRFDARFNDLLQRLRLRS